MTGVVTPLLGGVVIGLAAACLRLVLGRLCGVSGIVAGLCSPLPGRERWRVAFVGGLLAGGAALLVLMPSAIAAPAGRPIAAVALAGVLVGIGTRIGGGCTSGHGVIGLARGSKRSALATITFLATGMVTATILGLTGGA